MIYGVMMVIQTKTGQITGMRRIECDETIMVELSFTQLWHREYCYLANALSIPLVDRSVTCGYRVNCNTVIGSVVIEVLI